VNEGNPSRLIEIQDLVLLTDLVMRPSPCRSRPLCGLEDGDESVLHFLYVTKLVPHHVVIEAMLELDDLAMAAVVHSHFPEMVSMENVVAIQSSRNDPVVFRRPSNSFARFRDAGAAGLFNRNDAESVVLRAKPLEVCLRHDLRKRDKQPREVGSCLSLNAWQAVSLEQLASAGLPSRVGDEFQARVMQATR